MNNHELNDYAYPIIEQAGQPICVLHVDDDESCLTFSKEILVSEFNFEVDIALSVDEALKKIHTEKYDAIISDYEMPKKNGLQFLKELRDQKNQIPFPLFTGKGREEVAIKALNLGGNGYYTKQGGTETVYGELAHGINSAVSANKSKLALKEAEEKFRTIFENVLDVVTYVDTKGKMLDVNERVEELLGYKPEEIIGKHFTQLGLVSLKQIPKLLKLFFGTLKSGKAEGIVELELKHKNGQKVPVEVGTRFIRNEAGKIVGVVNIYRDITGRRKADKAIKSSEARFRSLYQNSLDGIIIADLDGRHEFANSAACQMVGMTEDEIRECKREDLVVSDNRMEQAFSERKRSGKSRVELTIRRKNGTTFEADVTSTIFKEADGTEKACIIMRDVTERRKTEEKLKESNLQLEKLNEKLKVVGGLTRHDVKNKLMVANTNAYLLKKKIGDQPELIQYVQGIETAIKQSDNLFEFSRLYEKIGAEHPIRMSVEECFNQAAALFSNANRVEIINRCRGLMVTADSMLPQLFYSLIDNSLKHGVKVTKITLNYVSDNEKIDVFYEDNGVGVPEAYKEKIFSEGFTTGNGLGLGLKLVKKMIEAYGWTIKETGIPGKGAKFKITIPNSQPS